MIGLLLRSRYVTAGATAILLVLLVLFGKKVRYEQSIGSFFADDDPYMAVYQKAVESFGDDNFVFLVYDDPELVSPAGLDRVAELAAAVRPERIGGVLRVESLDAMPLVWSIDDVLIALDRLPALARKAALGRCQADGQECRSQDQCDDGQRRGARRGRRRACQAEGPPAAAPAFPGHADRRSRARRQPSWSGCGKRTSTT